jgi:hypothetical protein
MRRVLPSVLVAVGVAVAFFVLRHAGGAPGGTAYPVHLGANVLQNMGTYLMWATDLVRPIPELVHADSLGRAWPGVLVAVVVGLFAFRGLQRTAVRWGLIWWTAALLPVLILQDTAYGHYAYVALAGLATAVAAALEAFVAGLAARLRMASARARRVTPSARGRTPSRPLPPALAMVLVLLLLVPYGLRADWLQGERSRLYVAGTDLLLDPLLRNIEVSRRAIASMGRDLPPGGSKVTVFVPEGSLTTFSARSGEVHSGAAVRRQGHLYTEAVMDSGRAFRVFYPQLDSVQFLRAWRAPYRDWHLAIEEGNGYLRNLGAGAEVHALCARDMLRANLNESARAYLAELRVAFPDDPPIRYLYSSALARTGEFPQAREQLEAVIRTASDDALVQRARQALESMPRLQVE